MIGFTLIIGWLLLQVSLVDLLDLRYNKESCIVLLPNVSLYWSGRGKELIATLVISWINLEFNLMIFDHEYYQDKLEEMIKEMEDDEE